MSLESDVYDLIQPLVGGTVIWMDQSAPRPALPYYAMKINSVRYVNRDWTGDPDANGNQPVTGDREFTLNIQRFQKYGPESVSGILQNVVDKLRLGTVIDKFQAKKLVAFDTGAVTDISALLDKTIIEKRAALDIFMRYKSRQIDVVEIVETVSVDANDDSDAGPYNPLVEVVDGVVIRP